MSQKRAWWPSGGTEPDPRWSLANERTALAYTRTSLSLIVSGLAVAGSRSVADTSVWFAGLGVPLILLGIAVAVAGGRRFVASQRAMRSDEPLGPPVMAAALPFAVAAIGVLAIVVAVVAALGDG
jgi:putative membrane protein